ncbi:MoxR family ATPase [bacterium]|nr:MoxR family ATPase [bacterium]
MEKIINKLEPGYIFETVFWMEKDSGSGLTLSAKNINGKLSDHRIVTDDKRVLPGQRCKVKVIELNENCIRVSYLGLADFNLKKDVYIEPGLLLQFEILLCSGRSILLEGPQGTGKTTVARALADSLGMHYVFFNCSVCFEPSDFVGSVQLVVNETEQVRTEWIPTEVLTAIYSAYENPGQRFLIFLDELNRCRSQAVNGIMSAIDSSRRIFDPRKNSYVAIPENIQWIAAINSGKQFTGTYKLDPAQLDRFSVLKMDYPPEAKEIDILSRRYDMVHRKDIRKVVKIANLIRNTPAISTDLSMRATDEACMFLSYPTFQHRVTNAGLIEILKVSFCNRLPGSTQEEGSDAQLAFNLIERNILIPSTEEAE